MQIEESNACRPGLRSKIEVAEDWCAELMLSYCEMW
jgi:hypothetical protein